MSESRSPCTPLANPRSPKMVDKLPKIPTKGNLDLERVKESMYAFS
nr:MAG TPA: DNA-dependent RNA polymerase [Caudoviricetes sp.]